MEVDLVHFTQFSPWKHGCIACLCGLFLGWFRPSVTRQRALARLVKCCIVSSSEQASEVYMLIHNINTMARAHNKAGSPRCYCVHNLISLITFDNLERKAKAIDCKQTLITPKQHQKEENQKARKRQ